MVTSDGRVKIADFGIAKATTKHADRRVPDRHRHDGRHPDLHGARAGDGAGHRPVDRPLLGRLHGVRDVHRAACRSTTPTRRWRSSCATSTSRPRAANSIAARRRPAAAALGRGAAREGPAQAPAERGGGLGRVRGDGAVALGPRWRREARLLDPGEVGTPRPLTPAPFPAPAEEAAEGSGFVTYGPGGAPEAPSIPQKPVPPEAAPPTAAPPPPPPPPPTARPAAERGRRAGATRP